MSAIGRNDPCPCGSGRKYKKCCGASPAVPTDSAYDNIRRLDGEYEYRVLKFAAQRYGTTALEDAWEDFFMTDEIPFDENHPEYVSFLRWFTFDWAPTGFETLAEVYLAEHSSKLAPDMRRFITTTMDAPYSFYQVLDVERGVGLTLRDILRKNEVEVKERTASTIIERGLIFFARVVSMDGVNFLMGNGAQPAQALLLDRVLELRHFIETDALPDEGTITSETLLAYEVDLWDFYFALADTVRNRSLDIRNTDGDPLALYTLTYRISAFEHAFNALKDLELRISRNTAESLLTPEGAVIHWLKRKRKKPMHDVITVATFTIKETSLVVDVNSERRSKLAQKEVARHLGSDAVLLKTEVISHEELSARAREPEHAPPESETEHERILREHPEVQEMLKKSLAKHWAAWPDTPLPALRGMTPREAAKDAEGRELLESLFLEFEAHNDAGKDESLRVDVTRLRGECGL